MDGGCGYSGCRMVCHLWSVARRRVARRTNGALGFAEGVELAVFAAYVEDAVEERRG